MVNSQPFPFPLASVGGFRDAHSRVGIFILVVGNEQVTSFSIKIPPHVFTTFSTALTVSLPHSAPTKAEMAGLKHLSTKEHPNPLDGPPPSPPFLQVVFMPGNIPIVPCPLLSMGCPAMPWGSVLKSPMSIAAVLVGDFHLDLALLQKQWGNNSS